MSSDHVLIKLSDFKEICTDLQRSGDIIKGVLKNTLKHKSSKRSNVKRSHADKKSDKKSKRKKPNNEPVVTEIPEETTPDPPSNQHSEDSNSTTELSSEEGY